MKPERWKRIEGLFAEALERTESDRESLLSERCGDDAELRREVESLLASHVRAGSFLDGAAALPETELEPSVSLAGRTLGPYRIVEVIGRGGMGSVYLASRADDAYRQEVAIKVVHREMASEAILERFRSERQILAALDHPGIARLLDGGTTDDGLPYLVMERVTGQPITAYANANRLSTNERLELFRSVCSAVEYAHRNLVVHRDLKPSNILVTPEGAPKLLDFGIARLLDAGGAAATATLTGPRMMTPAYASPEQLLGETITTASDVYSLGVLLYELLTDRRPYPGAGRNPEELIRQISAGEPRRPSAAAAAADATDRLPATVESRRTTLVGLRRRLEGDLDNIVLKALRSAPERRYSSVEQLSEDLRRHLGGLPVIARPDTFSYRAGKFVVRHKAAVATALLVAASLVGGSIAVAWQARVARTQRERAERRFAEVRRLATSFLFDFHDSIENLAGATEARRLVVERALVHLDGLSEEARDDPSLQRELAHAYERLSRIQGETFAANLGDSSASLESQRKAVAIYQGLERLEGGARARRELAGAYEQLGRRLLDSGDADAALDAQRRSLSLFEALADSDPKDADARYGMAEIRGRIGQALADQGEAAASLSEHRQAAEILEGLVEGGEAPLEVRRQLADAYLKIGMRLGSPMSANVGDAEGALASMQKALAAFEALALADPLDARLHRTVAAVHSNIGDVLESMGDPSQALASLRRATHSFRELAAADPSDAQARIDVALALLKGAKLLHAAGGTLPAAVGECREAVDLLEPLVASHPDNAYARAVLVHARSNYGDLLAEQGDFQAAERSYRQGISMQEELVGAAPASVSRRFNLAAAHSGLAAVHQLRGHRAQTGRIAHWRAARDEYDTALGLFEELRAEGALSGSDLPGIEAIARRAAEVDELLERR